MAIFNSYVGLPEVVDDRSVWHRFIVFFGDDSDDCSRIGVQMEDVAVTSHVEVPQATDGIFMEGFWVQKWRIRCPILNTPNIS